jgi:hypothetical protein
LLKLGIGVVADPGFLILRDVWRRHFERRLIPTQTAGKRFVGDVAGRSFWRVAIAAGENAIDQIIAALDQISVCPRNVECGDKHDDQCNCCPEQKRPPTSLAASIHARSGAAIQSIAKAIARIAAAIAA